MRSFLSSCAAVLLVLGVLGPALAAPAKKAPPDPMTQAFQLYQKGEYDKAAPILEKYLESHPDDPMAHYAMGLVQDKRHQYESSLQHLRKAMELKADLGQAKEAFAAVVQRRVYEQIDEQKFDEALALTDEAIRLLPEEAGVHFARGVVLFERWRQTENPQDHLQALQSWTRCRELKVVSATGEILNGIAAFESGDFKRAKEHFSVAQFMRAGNRYAIMWLGLAQAALGEYEPALEQLNHALEMFGKNPSLYRYIGDVYALQGKYAEAETNYRQALALKPGDARVHATLGELFVATGRMADAIKEYQEAARLRPRSWPYHFRLATLLRDSGQYDLALQALAQSRAILQGPEHPEADRVRDGAMVDLETALILLEKDQRDKAIETFSGKEAHISRERYPRVYLYLSQVGTHEKRLESIQAALKWSGPGARQLQADVFIAWGDLQKARNERIDAMEMYYQAWRRTPPDSARTEAIKSRFETARTEEIAAIEKRLSNIGLKFMIDPVVASSQSDALNKRLELVKKMQLGKAGDLATGGGTSATMPSRIVPAELEGELTKNVQTATSQGTEMQVKPSWEGGGTK